VFITASMVYNLIVCPTWHRCLSDSSALMAKLAVRVGALVRPVAHLPAAKAMGWQTTGSGKRKAGTRRAWMAWRPGTGNTGQAWFTLAVWRLGRYGVAFVPLDGTALVASAITVGRAPNHLRTMGGAIR
jgi:hypothetical protein